MPYIIGAIVIIVIIVLLVKNNVVKTPSGLRLKPHCPSGQCLYGGQCFECLKTNTNISL